MDEREMSREAARGTMADGSSEVEDLRLWSTANSGDTDARDKLAHIVAEVTRLCAARLRLTPAELEEVESRMQASVWEQMRVGVSTPRTSLRGWLRFRFLAVTKQYFRDLKKTGSFAPLLDEETTVGPLSLYQPLDPARQELRLALKVCLDKLPDGQREAVLSRHAYDHHAVGEFGELQGANPNTRRVWMFRGLAALRRCLQTRGLVA